MSSALRRGRTLIPEAVAMGREWRAKRLKELLKKDRLALTTIERTDVRSLTGMWDFWNYKEVTSEEIKEKS